MFIEDVFLDVYNGIIDTIYTCACAIQFTSPFILRSLHCDTIASDLFETVMKRLVLDVFQKSRRLS